MENEKDLSDSEIESDLKENNNQLITKYKKNSPFLESFRKLYDRTGMF
jgi:hypothetical protein